MISPHNPFPGMNPFLEMNWSDVHTQLIAYIRDELALRGLPTGLRARAEESLAVEEEAADEQRIVRPDVAVLESWKQGVPPSWRPSGEERGPVVVADPKIVLREPETERWIEITSIHGKLITVIELLSLSNKTGAGRERYLKKRETYEKARVNVVEIDLLRAGGSAVAAMAESPRDPSFVTRYTICVFRAARPGQYEVYHWGLGDRIPAFAVPLRVDDPDAAIDLQPLLNRAYEFGYYWQDDPQHLRLEPSLSDDERAFTQERLTAAGFVGKERGHSCPPE